MSHINDLANELLDLVMKELTPNLGTELKVRPSDVPRYVKTPKSDIAAASLVSRRWRHLAVCHLFRDMAVTHCSIGHRVILTPGSHKLDLSSHSDLVISMAPSNGLSSFLTYMGSNPSVASHVRSILLFKPDSSHYKDPIHPRDQESVHESLLGSLSRFPCLRKLTILNLDFCNPSADTICMAGGRFSAVINITNKSLSLHHADGPVGQVLADLLQVSLVSGPIRELSIDCITPHSSEDVKSAFAAYQGGLVDLECQLVPCFSPVNEGFPMDWYTAILSHCLCNTLQTLTLEYDFPMGGRRLAQDSNDNHFWTRLAALLDCFSQSQLRVITLVLCTMSISVHLIPFLRHIKALEQVIHRFPELKTFELVFAHRPLLLPDQRRLLADLMPNLGCCTLRIVEPNPLQMFSLSG